MLFRIADSFMKSLRRLDTQSQNLVRETTLNFQLDPSHPGMRFHKLSGKDPNFWSLRVNRDLRIIVHRDGAHNILLCWADHHDAAYAWAENRKLQTHPTTGAAQIVEVVERIEEVTRRKYRDPPVFARFEEDYLLALGVPEEWVKAVRTVDEAGFDKIADRLPEEASEHLLALLCGEVVPTPKPAKADSVDPFNHPDAQRRFRLMADQRTLQAALDAPWDQWVVFLHPQQESIVTTKAKGPMRVSGGAGTGKSVVALHRAARLARRYEGDLKKPVLLTTFSKTLACRLAENLDILLSSEPEIRKRIEVQHLHALAFHHWKSRGEAFSIWRDKQCEDAIEQAMRTLKPDGLDLRFLKQEWQHVIDAQGLDRWELYKKASRKGRGTPLSGKLRKVAWQVFDSVWSAMRKDKGLTYSFLCKSVARDLEEQDGCRYAHVIIDECQDLGQVELELLRQLVEPGQDDLCFCGDEGQRLFKPKTSWSKLGISIRGRSHHLRVNYRTTEQIRSMADRLHPKALTDGDGENIERDAHSLIFGVKPELTACPTPEKETEALQAWIRSVQEQGCELHEIAIFARTERLLKQRVAPILEELSLDSQQLKDDTPIQKDKVSIGTMHRAKGLEFRAVAVIGCEPGQIPNAYVRKKLSDPADIEDYDMIERNLLYVACTRAREYLLISGSPTLSELLPGSSSPTSDRAA